MISRYLSYYIQGDVFVQINTNVRIRSRPWLNPEAGVFIASAYTYPPRKLWGVFLPLGQLTFIKGATTALFVFA